MINTYDFTVIIILANKLYMTISKLFYFANYRVSKTEIMNNLYLPCFIAMETMINWSQKNGDVQQVTNYLNLV